MSIKMIHKILIPRFAFLPLMSLIALTTTGCRDESGSQQGDGTSLQVVSVSAAADVVVSAQKSSAALRSATSLTSGDIGVYRIVNTGVYTAQSNVKYTCTSGTWAVASGVTPIYLYSAAASICAYYPYSATIEDDPTTSGTTEANGPTAIPLTSQLYSTAADLCYASSVTPSSASPSVSFSMNRAYAKMTFTITHDASYSGTCAVSGITIANPGIRLSNTLDITSGTYGSTTASGSVTVNPAISSITSSSSSIATVLMVPTITGTTAAALTSDMTFLFTVDGNTHAATLPVSSNNLTTLAAGSNYQISVKISGSGMSVALGSTAGSGNSIMGATANCYVVAPGNSITIPVNICGNGTLVSGSGITSASIAPASVEVLWQTSINLISRTYNSASQTVDITASGTPTAGGNAVIAAYSGAGGSGTILWSWHIWVTPYNPTSSAITYTNDASTSWTVMDRNLGALGTSYSNDANILHYQWGRKDPFSAGTVVGTAVDITTSTQQIVGWSVQNPFMFIKISGDWCSTQTNALWGGASISAPTAKTMFDPCPSGWRVPAWRNSQSAWYNITTGTLTSSLMSIFGVSYPAAGYRGSSSGVLSYVGSYGYYWSGSPSSSNGYYLYFTSSSVRPAANDYRAYGFSVRCVQEF
jgi:hypothetical protein